LAVFVSATAVRSSPSKLPTTTCAEARSKSRRCRSRPAALSCVALQWLDTDLPVAVTECARAKNVCPKCQTAPALAVTPQSEAAAAANALADRLAGMRERERRSAKRALERGLALPGASKADAGESEDEFDSDESDDDEECPRDGDKPAMVRADEETGLHARERDEEALAERDGETSPSGSSSGEDDSD